MMLEIQIPDFRDQPLSAKVSRFLGVDVAVVVLRERWAHEGVVGVIGSTRGRHTHTLKVKIEDWEQKAERIFIAAEVARLVLAATFTKRGRVERGSGQDKEITYETCTIGAA